MIRVRQDGTKVFVEQDGSLILCAGWDKMRELGEAILKLSKKAEEWGKAVSIAKQNALLIRSGAPFGLTSNPVIQKESLGYALGDRNLRRFMPNRIKGVFGTPMVIHGSK